MHTGKAPFDDIRVRQAFSEALRREALTEFGKQTGLVGTGNYPAGPWAMPQPMREQLVGYGPDMAKRTAHAKALLGHGPGASGIVSRPDETSLLAKLRQKDKG